MILMASSTMWKCLQCVKNGALHAFHDFDSSFGVSFNIFLLLLTIQFKGKNVLSYFIKLLNSSSFSSVFPT